MGLQMKMMGNDGQHCSFTGLPIIFMTFFMKMMGSTNHGVVTQKKELAVGWRPVTTVAAVAICGFFQPACSYKA